VVPPERRSPVRATPVLDQVRGWIDEMLREDLAAPRKQRHTARRIFQRLVDEHDASVSYSYVAKYVHRRRPQVAAEAQGRAGVIEGYVPQTHEPGADAEVDFADLWIYLVGELVKCFLFTLRLSFSGRAVHRVFRTRSAGSRMDRSAMTTCVRPSSGSCSAAAASSRCAGNSSDLTTVSSLSIASLVRRERMRRAGWKATVAGSAATTWSRSRG
jgi:hypothetical protein